MTIFMEFMFCVNCHKRKMILFQCQDGARGGDRPCPPPVATPLLLLRVCIKGVKRVFGYNAKGNATDFILLMRVFELQTLLTLEVVGAAPSKE